MSGDILGAELQLFVCSWKNGNVMVMYFDTNLDPTCFVTCCYLFVLTRSLPRSAGGKAEKNHSLTHRSACTACQTNLLNFQSLVFCDVSSILMILDYAIHPCYKSYFHSVVVSCCMV